MTNHLMRICRSMPISRLGQGSTLSVRSAVPCHIFVQTDWRDDGTAELRQVFARGGRHREDQTAASRDAEVKMTVDQLEDCKTSLGRVAPHVSLQLLVAEQPLFESNLTGASAKTTNPAAIENVILDDGTIVSRHEAPTEEALRHVDYSDGVSHWTRDEDDKEEVGTFLSIHVPEKLNLRCELEGGGTITVPKKIEGDIYLHTTNGDISVVKLRGHEITVRADHPSNTIYASTLLEADRLSVQSAGRIRVQQLHCNHGSVIVKNDLSNDDAHHRCTIMDEDDEGSRIDISSLYVSGQGGATVSVRSSRPSKHRAIRVKSSHGPVHVSTVAALTPLGRNPHTKERYPLVELGGVNGSCEVSLADTRQGNSEDWTSCAIHVDSLAADSVSVVQVDHGKVALTLDRKVESDLRLLSYEHDSYHSIDLNDMAGLLADEEDIGVLAEEIRCRAVGNSPDQHEERIAIHTNAFTWRHTTSYLADNLEYADGWVKNKSEEPDSRFDLKMGRTAGHHPTSDDSPSIGKIRRDSAADQALHAFGNASAYARPLLAAVATSTISVETVSWLGAIARRYGLDEKASERKQGRTATRRGWPVLQSDDANDK